MPPKFLHRVARLVTIGLTVVGAAFGSIAGVAASAWGGVFVIVPIATAIFAIIGALLGGAIEFTIRLRSPTDYEL